MGGRYYAWRHRQHNPSLRQFAREKLDHLVAEAFAARKGRSGAVELTLDLDELGHSYNRKTAAAGMRRQGLVAKAAKKFKATTHNLLCSMSAKGCCYDNACAESFFHTFKVELIHGECFATREDMHRAIFEYVEVDYNRTRRHSANGYISPLAFENKKVA